MDVEVTTPGDDAPFSQAKLRFFDDRGTDVSVTLSLEAERTLMHRLLARAQERGEHLTI